MKKFLAALFAAIAAVCVFAFAGCKDEEKSGGKSGNVVINVESVVFTADGEVLTLTDTTSVKDYMDALSKNGELVFGGSESEYGFYLQSVYSTKAEGNAYWAVYTDLVKLEGDDAVYSNAEYGTYNYNGKTLNSASFGISTLPCVEGYTYALVYSTF